MVSDETAQPVERCKLHTFDSGTYRDCHNHAPMCGRACTAPMRKTPPSDVRSRERKSAAAKLIQFVRGRKLTDTTERDDPNAIEIWRTMPQRCATCLRMKKEPEPPRAYDNNTAHFDRAAGRYDRRSRMYTVVRHVSERAIERRSNRNLPPCVPSAGTAQMSRSRSSRSWALEQH